MRVIVPIVVAALLVAAGAIAFELLVEAADRRAEGDGEPDGSEEAAWPSEA